ncbi:transcriptional regulator [Emticicia aquatilis]|uniref:Transcriptional regulator n=1 Tax=Emticicia aquatilis TaxID=1537369 RepID=A0A916YTR0_9BACT|nr:helix-turn-helix transcriptional regulator [Emticicia aquatilis]GGD60701.1 transcriptional regulator [Emticicia aquatilis]
MNNVRNKELLIRFGLNLKRLREQQGLSQEELYYRANLSKNQIGNIERGEVNTTISTVYVIAKALQIDVKELFMFENEL